MLLNMPVVPDKSIARERLNGGSAGLQRAWKLGNRRDGLGALAG